MGKKAKKYKSQKKMRRLAEALSGIEEDLTVVIRTLGDLQDRVEKRERDEEEFDVPAGRAQVDDNPLGIQSFDKPFKISAPQGAYLNGEYPNGTWILGADDKGWILVGEGSKPHDAEGQGVWVDNRGNEHFGPSGFGGSD